MDGGTFSGEDIADDSFEILNFTKSDVAALSQYQDKRLIRASKADQIDVHGLGS